MVSWFQGTGMYISYRLHVDYIEIDYLFLLLLSLLLLLKNIVKLVNRCNLRIRELWIWSLRFVDRPPPFRYPSRPQAHFRVPERYCRPANHRTWSRRRNRDLQRPWTARKKSGECPDVSRADEGEVICGDLREVSGYVQGYRYRGL